MSRTMHYYVVEIVPWINSAMNQQAKWAWFDTALSKLLRNNYDGNVSHGQGAGSLSRNCWSSGTVCSRLSRFTSEQKWLINSLIQRGNVWSIIRPMSWLKSTSQKQTWRNLKPKKVMGSIIHLRCSTGFWQQASGNQDSGFIYLFCTIQY